MKLSTAQVRALIYLKDNPTFEVPRDIRLNTFASLVEHKPPLVDMAPAIREYRGWEVTPAGLAALAEHEGE